jgi:hypothetical protein
LCDIICSHSQTLLLQILLLFHCLSSLSCIAVTHTFCSCPVILWYFVPVLGLCCLLVWEVSMTYPPAQILLPQLYLVYWFLCFYSWDFHLCAHIIHLLFTLSVFSIRPLLH